ncbi:MAG: TlpA disulfide reductase family protein [Balneolaceae bacterium]
MRLEQKYFYPFMGVCAAISLVLILFGTFHYQDRQHQRFTEHLATIDFDTLRFDFANGSNELHLRELRGKPIVIDFWSTWSDMSMSNHNHLQRIKNQYPELEVVAVAVRDSRELVQDYVEEQSYPFYFVIGTGFYEAVQVPGLPSQLMIDRNLKLFDKQIGIGVSELEEKLMSLIRDE